MTRLVVALALVGSLLSNVNELLTFLGSLQEPGPILARAVTTLLKRTAPPLPCFWVLER